MSSYIRAGALCMLAALISGCGTAFIGARVADTKESPKQQAALRYYLPEDVVEVIVTLERTTSKRVTGTADAPTVEVQESAVPVGATVNLQTIADTSTTYLLDATASALTKNNTALIISETGLLQSVNAKSTGTGGIVFDNVMKIAGTVLPLVNLATGKFSIPTSKAVEGETTHDIRSMGEGFRTQLGGLEWRDARTVGTAECTNETYLFKNHFPNTPKFRYAFKDLVRKQELIANFCDTMKYLVVRRNAYRKALSELDGATSSVAVKALTSKVDKLRLEYDSAVTLHVAARTGITTAVEDALTAQGIGSKSERYTQRAIMHLSTLPARASLVSIQASAPAGSTPDVADDLVRGAFRNAGHPPLPDESKGAAGQKESAVLSPEAFALFQSTGIIIAAEPLSKGADADETGASKPAPAVCNVESDVTPCVFYRTPRPYLLSAWTVQSVSGKNEQRKLIQSDSKVVDAIGDGSPAFAIALRDSTFTKRDTTLAFSTRGRLTGLTRDYGSAAEDASASIASGFTSGLSQYNTTLSSIKTIRATENELELQPLQQRLALAKARADLNLQPIQAQVAQAQQQLALIEQQTKLDAATQGQAASLQAQLTNIQNSLVAAQTQLVNSQTSLAGAEASATNAENQAELAASASMLQAQIKELQNEVDLLKLRQQLKELKKKEEE